MKVYVGIPEALIILLVTGILSSREGLPAIAFRGSWVQDGFLDVLCAQITWVFSTRIFSIIATVEGPPPVRKGAC